MVTLDNRSEVHNAIVFRRRASRTALSTAERGLTLVEIMIVLTIMASIMGVVGVFANGAIQNARVREAETEVANLAQYVTQYYVFQGEYPDSLDQLTDPPGGMAPVTESIPADPWGNDYQYSKSNNTTFELFSMGPDGSRGGDDDIHGGSGGND